MAQSKLIYQQVLDEDDPEYAIPGGKFIMNTNGVSFTFYFTQDTIKVSQWEKILGDIKEDKKSSLIFGSFNGNGGIYYENGEVIFGVSRYGDENFSDMTFKLPVANCVDALQSAKESLETFFSKK